MNRYLLAADVRGRCPWIPSAHGAHAETERRDRTRRRARRLHRGVDRAVRVRPWRSGPGDRRAALAHGAAAAVDRAAVALAEEPPAARVFAGPGRDRGSVARQRPFAGGLSDDPDLGGRPV